MFLTQKGRVIYFGIQANLEPIHSGGGINLNMRDWFFVINVNFSYL